MLPLGKSEIIFCKCETIACFGWGPNPRTPFSVRDQGPRLT